MERRHPEMLNPANRNNKHLVFKWLDEVVHHRTILDAVEDLIGPNILVWGSVLFIKEPDSEAFVSWHQDMTYAPLDPYDGVTAWLELTASNQESGCMQMVPGSHHDPIRTHHDRYGEHNILTRGQTIEGLDETQAVDVILEPGQISLHHGCTIHSSTPNRSSKRRIGIAIQQYLPTHVREVNGRGYAQLARGKDGHDHFEHQPRPQADMTPQSIAVQTLTNEHCANFLYKDASQKRAY